MWNFKDIFKTVSSNYFLHTFPENILHFLYLIMFLRRSCKTSKRWANLSPGARRWTKKYDEVCWASTSTCLSFEMSFQPFWRGKRKRLPRLGSKENCFETNLVWSKEGDHSFRRRIEKFIRNLLATAAILHRHDQRNSANDSFSFKRHYSVARKHGSYLSFSSKNRYCLRWCYWQCPAWRQILVCS